MLKRATIADVAALAGVHKATVSRALNPGTEQQVNSVTLRRVQRAAKELGYVPNGMARSLRTSLSLTIGVIVPDLTNAIFPPIVRGIENYLSPRGYTALVANTDGQDALEQAEFESLIERRVDGFIIATGRSEHPLLEDAYDRGIRAVMVNRGSPGTSYPLVVGDDSAGIAAGVRHLRSLGHRSALHLAGPSTFTTGRIRSEAFVSACLANGVEPRVVEMPALSIEAAVRAMGPILDGPDLPTAIMAGNDLLALGVLRTLRGRGMSCPGDVSLIGFNDMPFAEDFNPALTTVRVPFLDMGFEAARLLLDGIGDGAQRPVTVTLPVELIVRDSTGAPRAA